MKNNERTFSLAWWTVEELAEVALWGSGGSSWADERWIPVPPPLPRRTTEAKSSGPPDRRRRRDRLRRRWIDANPPPLPLPLDAVVAAGDEVISKSLTRSRNGFQQSEGADPRRSRNFGPTSSSWGRSLLFAGGVGTNRRPWPAPIRIFKLFSPVQIFKEITPHL